MNNKNAIFIGILILSFLASPIWLWYGHSGFDYGKAAEMTFSYIGSAIGGITTLIALYITVNQTRKIQEDNNKNQLKQDKRIITNEVEILVSKYITDIGFYFKDQAIRSIENSKEINRREAIQSLRLLEIKLKNIELANELLEKVRFIHKNSSKFDKLTALEKDAANLEKNINDLIDLTIQFSENYKKI